MADTFKYGPYRNGLDRGMKQSEYVKLLEEIVDTYVDHISWRCQYRERYHECRCGLDEMMARIGRATIPVDDPEAPRDSTTLVSRQLRPYAERQKGRRQAHPARGRGVNHCGMCKRRTFDYRWYNRTPWWIVPRWLSGRMDCGGECMHCLSAIEEPDCDHEWQTRPINGTATATPQCSSYECVRCGSLLFETIFARSCATKIGAHA